MEFFGRELELEMLQREQELSYSSARFTIIMGRRRIGKTCLIRRSLQGVPCLYLLAKNEAEVTGNLKKYRVEYRGYSMEDM